MDVIEFIEQVLEELSLAEGRRWAEVWVNRRMEFHRRFSPNRIFSTRLGSEFFRETKRLLESGEVLQPEPGEKLGEYDNCYNRWLHEQQLMLRKAHTNTK